MSPLPQLTLTCLYDEIPLDVVKQVEVVHLQFAQLEKIEGAARSFLCQQINDNVPHRSLDKDGHDEAYE